MTKQGVNEFDGGMEKDLDRHKVPHNKYIDALNLRLLTTEGGTTGSFENIRGNKVISTTNLVTGKIIGSCEFRDYLIIFTTDNVTSTPVSEGGASRIYKLVINLATETQTSLTLLYDDSLNNSTGKLNFSTYYPIKAVAKYEAPTIQKVYWVDGYNVVRYANVAANLTVDGTVYTSNNYMSADKFDFLPKFNVSKPVLTNITGGKINTGIIAYAYQLYILNGAETAISPLSDPISIVSDNDFLNNSNTYKGAPVKVDSGKGCVLQIDNRYNVGFNRLRLYRVEYEYINQEPRIVIAAESDISTSGGMVSIIDVGDDLGTITTDQFNIDSTELFSAQDIATKNARLFVSNITESTYTTDPTWDSRAVRFKSGSTATVYDDGTPVTINIPAGDTLAQWNAAGWSNYTLTHDGVNNFNDPTHDGDSNYAWKYCANGTTLGAEGPNIKIDFGTDQIVIDDTNDNTTFGTYSPDSLHASDLSYESYASPWKGSRMSWQRDEVYRLFVAFGNNRGQIDFPKWICDLRMPSFHDDNFQNTDGTTCYPSILAAEANNKVSTYRLYPRIFFKSFPSNATFARIYRVKREREDRSVVSQCLGIQIDSANDNSYGSIGVLYPSLVDDTLTGCVKLVSPEINITKNITYRGNDYLEYITNFSNGYAKTAQPILGGLHKLKTNTKVSYSSAARRTLIDAKPCAPSATTSYTIPLASGTFCNYMAYYVNAKGSTGLATNFNTSGWTALGNKYTIINYKSNVFNSQYGGNTYENRQRNTCLPCSDVIFPSNINTWININYGDTFINYFDVSTLLADLTKDIAQATTYAESVFVPLESSINCDLRSDTYSAHIPSSIDNRCMRQEYSGRHQDAHSHWYIQNDNLYIYNTVYSQQSDLQSQVCLSADITLVTLFDCKVKASNIKQNGEVTDSWTKFGVNEEIEVDSGHGSLNALFVFKDEMYFLQDKAFGTLSVNERALIKDTDTSKLVLGTGEVLDRYDYVNTTCGCKDKFSVVFGDWNIYWYDRVYNYLAGYVLVHSMSRSYYVVEKISLGHGMQSFLDLRMDPTFKVIAVSDKSNHDILFTFFQDNNSSGATPFTLCYSDKIDAYVSFYSFIPTLYIPYQKTFLTTTLQKYSNSIVNLNYIFLHNSILNPRCYFWGLDAVTNLCYNNCTLQTLFNHDYEFTKTWDNIFYVCNVYDPNGIELFDQTIDQIRCSNDYQNSDYINLQYGVTLRRRERIWTVDIPRNSVISNYTSNPNIFLQSNINATRTFRERLRDKFMTVDLVFVNNATRRKMVLESVGAKYRLSYR